MCEDDDDDKVVAQAEEERVQIVLAFHQKPAVFTQVVHSVYQNMIEDDPRLREVLQAEPVEQSEELLKGFFFTDAARQELGGLTVSGEGLEDEAEALYEVIGTSAGSILFQVALRLWGFIQDCVGPMADINLVGPRGYDLPLPKSCYDFGAFVNKNLERAWFMRCVMALRQPEAMKYGITALLAPISGLTRTLRSSRSAASLAR